MKGFQHANRNPNLFTKKFPGLIRDKDLLTGQVKLDATLPRNVLTLLTLPRANCMKKIMEINIEDS